MKKRLFAVFVSLCLIVSMLPVTVFAGEEQTAGIGAETVAECICTELCSGDKVNKDCPVCSAEGAELDKVCVGAAPMLLGAPRSAKQVTYLDENGNQNTATATQVTSSHTQWQNGWYVVDSDVTINERVTVEGSVQLILASGYTLTAKKGINVSDKNSFTVYAQSTDKNAGKLTAGYDHTFDSCIGGKKEETNGNITINGGTIELSSRLGAGIGSGREGNSTGGITINGGHIRISTSSGAGIGAGAGAQNDSNITINGGNIDITVEAASAGIGGGSGAGEQHGNNNGTIQITGGTVIANVGYSTTTNSGGAGIGGGNLGAGGTIIISGGNISVHAGTGAGIGGGATGKGGNVTITGGTVTATSELGASIGAGASNSEHGTLTIAPTSGKVITADAGTDENSSVPLKGSPFTNSTEVISQLTGTKYFHSEIPNITVITQHPNDQIVNDGSSATFTVAATGSGTLTYQWQQSTDGSTWTNITGATDDTYTTAATTIDMNGWQYRCVVKNSIYEVTSDAALLTVKHNLVKTEYKAPTCTVDGTEEYWYCETCKKYFSDENGTTPTTPKENVIPATGHSYGKPEWNWSENGKTCTVTFTCKNDETHKESPKVDVTPAVKKPATCTETGVTTYTATVEFNGQTHMATKDVADIPPTGHSYGKPEWNWSEDGKTCTVTFTCENDATHKESPEVEVTPEVKKVATCTERGVTTYTATVKFNGETYTNSKDVSDIPATGHSYDNGKCTVCGAIASDFKVVITEGANGSWQKGTKDGLSFTSNAAYEHFQKVQVDGKDLDASNYTVKEGSTIVTLKASYLETLSVGKHTLSIVSDTGTATTEFTIDGWKTEADGNRYYYRDGERVKGEFIKAETAGDYYFTDPDTGAMVRSDWVSVQEADPYNNNIEGTVWYHMGTDGLMQRGWIKDETGWKIYYLDSNGRMYHSIWINAAAQPKLGMPAGLYKLCTDGAVQMNGWAKSIQEGIWWFCEPDTGWFNQYNPSSWSSVNPEV